MSSELYSEMREDTKRFADYFEENGFKYDIHNKGILLNVYDLNGVKQSYYTTTNTAVFHRSNDYYDRATFTFRNIGLEKFTDYLRNPDKIQKFF